MRHASKTHRVALDWLCDRINSEPKVQIKHVDTKNQLADILTKGSFSKYEWNHFLCLFIIMSFPTYSRNHFQNFHSQCRERLAIGIMSKRGQDAASGDGSPLAKARHTNFVMRSQCKEDISKQRLGSLVNPENDNEKERVGQASGHRVASSFNSGVEYAEVKRPDKVNYAQGDLERDKRVRRDP